jgi:transcriptional regulator with XRE-family HTH domain
VAARPVSRGGRHVFFPREFLTPIPDEVSHAIANGTYFLRAWREYRKFKTRDAADLTGLKMVTIVSHEQGYNPPTTETLRRFADIYDCSIEQLTAVSNSLASDSPGMAKNSNPEKYASIDTDYPDTVLDHIRSGKSPITAWRIYRRLSDRQLAEQFGTTEARLQEMIKADHLSDKTLRKFGKIFHCTEDQLRRPEGLVIETFKVRRAAPRSPVHGGLQATTAM